jgi:hypothetical protein
MLHGANGFAAEGEANVLGGASIPGSVYPEKGELDQGLAATRGRWRIAG